MQTIAKIIVFSFLAVFVGFFLFCIKVLIWNELTEIAFENSEQIIIILEDYYENEKKYPEEKEIDELFKRIGISKRVNYFFFNTDIEIIIADDRKSYILRFYEHGFIFNVYYSKNKEWTIEM